jgi:Protein of unknown function (DUF2442)
MVKITHLTVFDNYCIRLVFNDGCQKTVNFRKFLKEDVLTGPLLDPQYFRQVRIDYHGRGIYWPNGYDVCPDNLRYYLAAVETQSVAEREESLV